MMQERYAMNDQVAKQRVLGAIHAAPNGITFTTLAWLTVEQGALRPQRIRELAHGYAHRQLIRIDDDVCYPTAKLTREVARWRVEKPRVQAKDRGGRPGKATAEQRRLVVKAWREEPVTLRDIAERHNLPATVVRRIIDSDVGEWERKSRRAERASLIRSARRAAFLEAVRRRETCFDHEAA